MAELAVTVELLVMTKLGWLQQLFHSVIGTLTGCRAPFRLLLQKDEGQLCLHFIYCSQALVPLVQVLLLGSQCLVWQRLCSMLAGAGILRCWAVECKTVGCSLPMQEDNPVPNL